MAKTQKMEKLPKEFKVVDRKVYPLPGTNNRFYHIATIRKGLREFMFFTDMYQSTSYIEEVTGGHLDVITDESLWQSLANFLEEEGLRTIRKR